MQLLTKDNIHYQLFTINTKNVLCTLNSEIVQEKVFDIGQIGSSGFYSLKGLYYIPISNTVFKINEYIVVNNNYLPIFLLKYDSQVLKNYIKTSKYSRLKFSLELSLKDRLNSGKLNYWKRKNTLYYSNTDNSFLKEYTTTYKINYPQSKYYFINGEIWKEPEYKIKSHILNGSDFFHYNDTKLCIDKLTNNSWQVIDVTKKRDERFGDLFSSL